MDEVVCELNLYQYFGGLYHFIYFWNACKFVALLIWTNVGWCIHRLFVQVNIQKMSSERPQLNIRTNVVMERIRRVIFFSPCPSKPPDVSSTALQQPKTSIYIFFSLYHSKDGMPGRATVPRFSRAIVTYSHRFVLCPEIPVRWASKLRSNKVISTK